jgi:ATPase subunit of ABC transporter with duplicated ATPase domains
MDLSFVFLMIVTSLKMVSLIVHHAENVCCHFEYHHLMQIIPLVAGWILELDRGEGIPHEGNYSGWLEAKSKRLEGEKKTETAAAKAVSAELEWIRSNPKAQGNKSKARLKRYDELLLAAAPTELRSAGQIYIPPGPRLGDVVVDVTDLKKSFDESYSLKVLTSPCPRLEL